MKSTATQDRPVSGSRRRTSPESGWSGRRWDDLDWAGSARKFAGGLAAIMALLLLCLLLLPEREASVRNAPESKSAGPALSPPPAKDVAARQKPTRPSSRKPDNIVLALTDAANRMAVNWRTSADVADGYVRFGRVGDDPATYREAKATVARLESDELTSDRTVNCFSAAMDGLEPGGAYRYRVGGRARDAWSDWIGFGGGTERGGDCSFVYLGDFQEGFEAVGRMLSDITERHPRADLFLVGGDLVDFGEKRNEWDELMRHVSPVFSRVPVMPTLGNHDRTEDRDVFSRYFAVPGNGLDNSGECVNYHFVHGNVFFAVLDSEYSKSRQKPWLERVLKKADEEGHAFKVAMFHKPVFHPRTGAARESMLKHWVPLFDEHGVDLVLTGHGHSYVRTPKMRGGAVAGEGSPGTVYVSANSGDKHNEHEPLEIAAVQFSGTPTYQLVETTTPPGSPPVLRYRAFDREGGLMDEFTLTRREDGAGLRREAVAPPAGGGGRRNEDDEGRGNGVAANGRLRVEGTRLLNERGDPVQLRGLSSHGIHWYPQFANIRALRDIKARGANLFRVAMYADSVNNGYNAGGRDRRLNKRLLRLAVENSLAADLYTIIDWHLLEDENPLRHADKAVEFFDEMSRIHADDPGVIYEICNEPNGATGWRDISDYAKKVIPAIRANSPHAVIIVGTPKYSSDVLKVLDSPLPYDNILYAYHMYTGYTNYDFRRVLDGARAGGLPVFVSEWGISSEKGRDFLDVEEGYAFLEYMRANGISWAYWALCNSDREYVAIRTESDKLSGWLDEDLTVPGRIIFSALADGRPLRLDRDRRDE